MSQEDDNDNVITKDSMVIYISVIKEQVQQMSVVVLQLEQLNEKTDKIEEHFNNGFKADIMNNQNAGIEKISAQIEKVGAAAAVLAAANEKNAIALAALNDKNTASTISNLDINMANMKWTLRLNVATNVIGWASLIVTLVFKLFGKG